MVIRMLIAGGVMLGATLLLTPATPWEGAAVGTISYFVGIIYGRFL